MKYLVFFAAVLSQGCSLVVDTRCFEGECADASLDAPTDVTLDAKLDATPDVQPDVAPDVKPDAADAAPDANDVCLAFTADPCRNVAKGNGGCYCSASTQSGFDSASAIAGCIYRCNDSTTPTHTDSVKTCGGTCTIAPSGVEDYCSNQSACTNTITYCYDHCTD